MLFVLLMMMMIYVVARTALPPELQHAGDYLVGLRQMANLPPEHRHIVDLGKWILIHFKKPVFGSLRLQQADITLKFVQDWVIESEMPKTLREDESGGVLAVYYLGLCILESTEIAAL